MIEFYPQIKLLHIACIVASGSLFVLRGLIMLAGMRGYRHIGFRALSWTIDTTLLTAALMLATILHQYPFVHGWLTVKVLLLVAYIGLGSVALRESGTRLRRGVFFAAAVLVYLAIYSVARAHHPLGVLNSLFS